MTRTPCSLLRWLTVATPVIGLLVLTGCASSAEGTASEEGSVVTDGTEDAAGSGSGEAEQWTFVPPTTDATPTTEDSGTATPDADNSDGSTTPPEPSDAGPVPDPEDGGANPSDGGSPEDASAPPPGDTAEPPEDINEDADELTDEGGPGAEDIEVPPEDTKPTDPCESLDCSTPPKSLCDGHVAVTYPQGECVVTDDGAECQYPPVTKDCFETGGQFCENGACVGCSSDQQCNDILAPSVACEGEYTALYMSWKCDEGACTSVTISAACDGPGTMSCAEDLIQWTLPECVESLGCIEVLLDDEVDCGALGLTCLELDEPTCVDAGDVCLTEDECKTPPVSLCDGTTAISYPAQGDCQGPSGLPGVCVYNPTVTQCDPLYEFCEEGACWDIPTPCDANDCIEWPLEVGGNGHWYELVIVDDTIEWTEAKALAEEMGGHLATATTKAENNFIYDNLANNEDAWGGNGGPWLGGYQEKGGFGFIEPIGGWTWVTGEAWAPLFIWAAGEPNNWQNSNEDYLHYFQPSWGNGPANTWNDAKNDANVNSLIVEYPWP